MATKVEFQEDTASSFATGENNVAATLGTPKNVPGLGDAAYETTGFLAALKGSMSIKIVSALSTSAQLEALAHRILG